MKPTDYIYWQADSLIFIMEQGKETFIAIVGEGKKKLELMLRNSFEEAEEEIQFMSLWKEGTQPLCKSLQNSSKQPQLIDIKRYPYSAIGIVKVRSIFQGTGFIIAPNVIVTWANFSLEFDLKRMESNDNITFTVGPDVEASFK